MSMDRCISPTIVYSTLTNSYVSWKLSFCTIAQLIILIYNLQESRNGETTEKEAEKATRERNTTMEIKNFSIISRSSSRCSIDTLYPKRAKGSCFRSDRELLRQRCKDARNVLYCL